MLDEKWRKEKRGFPPIDDWKLEHYLDPLILKELCQISSKWQIKNRWNKEGYSAYMWPPRNWELRIAALKEAIELTNPDKNVKPKPITRNKRAHHKARRKLK
jgi:hypothetical protein